MTTPPSEKGGLHAALKYTGIPPSWLEKRPKLPSRNWLIFMSVVGSLTALYVDDRRKCKQIRNEYIEKVQHLAEVPVFHKDWTRKVTVYSCRYPEDHDHERSMKYFKKYVKPIFVAAAVDYDIINGNQYGALASKVADDIKKKRREIAGLEKSRDQLLHELQPQTGDRSPTARRRRELGGGAVIIGRHSLKEYMEGLRRGWSESMLKRDAEEEFANTLPDDVFDDPLASTVTEASMEGLDSTSSSSSSSPLSPPVDVVRNRSPLFGQIRQPPVRRPTPASLDVPPAMMPLQAPIGLVPFTNHIGFKQVPYMIYDFFTERYRVLSGCQAAYAIVMENKRPMTHIDSMVTSNDLDFDRQSERYIKSSWNKLPKRTETAKTDYYKELKDKIKVARELAYGEREPTRAERSNPPMTEVELRGQRLKKELKWKDDLEGWEVLSGEVVWDDKFEGALEVFVAPTHSSQEEH
ncbi:mitochondrial import inner membrane translocase subunit tim54 [Serendipita sp. 397]|nr:mitochondrial import inner membrane translocase subunit tim54 [Serendipita sp. 397]